MELPILPSVTINVATVRYSHDLTTWSTLLTYTAVKGEQFGSGRCALTVIDGDVYFSWAKNIFRIPSTAFGGIPAKNNKKPQAQNDTFTGLESGVAFERLVGLQGLLANDRDANDDIISIASYTQPKQGTLALDKHPERFPIPVKDGFSGTDTFTYTLTDGISSDTATVSLVVGDDSKPQPSQRSLQPDPVPGAIWEDEEGMPANADGAFVYPSTENKTIGLVKTEVN